MIDVIETFFGMGAVIISFAYAFARKYNKDEYTRTFLFVALLLFIVLFLVSLTYR